MRFDWSAAADFSSACRNAANEIEGQQASRQSWANTALEEFSGWYATLFRDNASVQNSDATNLVAALRDAATKVDRLADEARKEQTRRSSLG